MEDKIIIYGIEFNKGITMAEVMSELKRRGLNEHSENLLVEWNYAIDHYNKKRQRQLEYLNKSAQDIINEVEIELNFIDLS